MRLRPTTFLPLLAVLALVPAALLPLLSEPLPRSADGRPHLLRMAALAMSLDNGELWPRFSPDLVYGYGYPLFHYYAPLIYYLGVGLHALGLSFTAALHVIFGLALVLGAWGAWTLAEEWFGSAAGGLAAAAVYAFAPYTLFNLFARGAAPEALATALLPWLLWSLTRALRAPSVIAWLRLALLTAVLFLTHNLSSLAAFAFALAWSGIDGVILIREARSPSPRPASPGRGGRVDPSTDNNRPSATRRLSLATGFLLTGLALSAFFWLPAFLETNLVQVSELTTPATLDFRNYFLTPAQLLAPSFTFDPRLEPPAIPVAFGLPQALLPLLAVLLWRRYVDPAARWRVAALAAMLAGLLFLTTRASLPVWEALGPLRLMQFPWRFLGPATVLAALLAAAAVSVLGPRHPATHSPTHPLPLAWLVALNISLAAALLTLPWTFVTRYPAAELPPNPTLATIRDYEIESGGFGLTSTGEFLPVGVETLPDPPPSGAVERLGTDSLPPSVTVLQFNAARLEAEARFASPQPFDAVFRWFFFPGWRAEIDGRPAEARASGPHGFVTVAVPAGEHTLRVFFDSAATPVRQAGFALSALGALGLAGLLLRSRRPTTKDERRTATADALSSFVLRPSFFIVFGLGLLFALTRFWADGCANLWCRSRFDGAAVAGAARALDLDFGGALHLIGFDPPPADPLPADQPLRFTLYWSLFEPTADDYSIAAQLWDADGHLVGQQDAWHPGGQPTTRWLAGGYAIDAHTLTPFPGTPPGEYRLMIGAYPAGGAAVDVREASGLPLGRYYEAARVTLAPPTRPPSDAELNPSRALRAALGALDLVGLDGLGGTIRPGEAVPLVLYWRAQSPVPDLRFQFDLVSPTGASLSLASVPIPAGQAVRQPVTLIVPAGAPSGSAEVQVSVRAPDGRRLSGPVALGGVNIVAPERRFDLPEIGSLVGARFGDGLELAGYTLNSEILTPGGRLDVTLVWRALATMSARYAVSAQLLDEQGRLAAQADSEPAHGQRPTTGWLPPEVVVDEHALPVSADAPPGRYRLQVVVYDPRTGARLPALDATGSPIGDNVVLSTITLAP